MSQASPSQDRGVELRISLPGDIQVVAHAPTSSAARAAELLGHISLFQASAPFAGSDCSFELVSSVGDPEVSSPPRSKVLETRDSIQRSFEPCPVRLFSHCARLCGSSLSGKERVERGQWAGAVRAELWCRARSGSSGFRRRFQVTHGNPAEVFPALGFPARFRKAVGDTSEDHFFCLSFFPQLQNFALLWGL